MNYLIKILFVVTCILQATTIYGQSILNQYDEQGNKHGQWVEDANITGITGRKSICNYNHGKKEGYFIYMTMAICHTWANMRTTKMYPFRALTEVY